MWTRHRPDALPSVTSQFCGGAVKPNATATYCKGIASALHLTSRHVAATLAAVTSAAEECDTLEISKVVDALKARPPGSRRLGLI